MQVSPEFREWWQRHDVAEAHTCQKELDHPLVGQLALQATTLLVADDPNLKLFIYTPLPQANTAQPLAWLAGQTRTEAQVEAKKQTRRMRQSAAVSPAVS